MTFHDWSTDDDEGGAVVDPASVVGHILDGDLTLIAPFSPIRDEVGVYHFDWTPLVLGSFYIEFVGTFVDSSTDVVRDLFVVSAAPSVVATLTTLGDTQYVNWMTALDPMYLDADELLAVYPDASPLDCAEFICIYSGEVRDLFTPKPATTLSVWTQWDGFPATTAAPTMILNPNFSMVEYIRAASLCSLSRIYDINAGFGDTITLGDLTVQQNRFNRNLISRANAMNWCELAFALRQDLIHRSGLAGMKQIEKGAVYVNPLDTRELRSKEVFDPRDSRFRGNPNA